MKLTAAEVAVPASTKNQTGWVEVVRLASEAKLTAQQVADLLRHGISGEGLPVSGPVPTIPELTSVQVKAAVYRAAIRLISGGQPETDDLDTALLVALEAKLMAHRAEMEGLPHVAAALDRCCALHPIALAAVKLMVRCIVEAAPALPPVAETEKRKR